MRDMFESFRWAWHNDRKELITSIVFGICWLALTWFLFTFFIPVFAYDM
jgi:hypothetical protein